MTRQSPFGETPAIKRPYYYNEDTKQGHYPFDDKLGLIGRYTPAVANEMIRYAVNHPYEDAAKAFSRNHIGKVASRRAKSKACLIRFGKKHKDKLGKDAMREYKYFRGNAERMQYDVYRANGWF